MRASPAVDGEGRIFVGFRNRVLAFLPDESRPNWEYETTGPILRSLAIGSDGNIRIHGCDGFLHVISAAGQRVFEPVAVGDPLGWAMPLVDSANNTWICRHDGGLMKVDSTGQTDRRPFLRTRLRFDSTGLILDDRLFVGGEDHFLHAIRIRGERGEDLWETSPKCGRTGCAIHGAVALASGPQLLVASQDNHLHAFGLDGQEQWSVLLPGQPLGSPVVHADGTIYLGISRNPRNQDARGTLLALDSVSHQARWSYEAAGPVESTPVIGEDGIVYFGDNAGVVHAVDRQGEAIWTAPIGVPVRSAGAIVGAGLVAFGLDDGSFAVLRCSSPRLLPSGWPKLGGTAQQAGLVGGRP